MNGLLVSPEIMPFIIWIDYWDIRVNFFLISSLCENVLFIYKGVLGVKG